MAIDPIFRDPGSFRLRQDLWLKVPFLLKGTRLTGYYDGFDTFI
jgi:hypothetical protein